MSAIARSITESRAAGLVDQCLDSFLHAVIDATVDLIAQPRVERVNERLGEVLDSIAQVWTFSPKASEESFDSWTAWVQRFRWRQTFRWSRSWAQTTAWSVRSTRPR